MSGTHAKESQLIECLEQSVGTPVHHNESVVTVNNVASNPEIEDDIVESDHNQLNPNIETVDKKINPFSYDNSPVKHIR